MSRRATGLERPYGFPTSLNQKEDEFLTRLSIELKRSKAELLRSHFFTSGWEKRLAKLRVAQKDLDVTFYGSCEC